MAHQRARVLRELSAVSGFHLVLVRYKPGHDTRAEWVYNDADIDHARIIWARDMGPAKNQELLDYYKGRHAWLLEADEQPPKLASYPTGVQNAMK